MTAPAQQASAAEQELRLFVADELAQPVSPAALAMSGAIRSRHGDAALAVLFYGSCLRQPETQLVDSLLDFYLLVDDYTAAYDKRWLACANQLLPPNVFYLEIDHGTVRLRAKYAVISLRQFQHGTSAEAANVSLWARFCQPVRLTWCRHAAAGAAVAAACSEAVLTLLANALPSPAERRIDTDPEAPSRAWIAGFQATYRAEVRPEGPDRAVKIVASDLERYQAITPLALAVLAERPLTAAAASWAKYRVIGKLLNVARLVKAAFTFEGGLDYALWKIARHSGITVEVSDWQRRHPLLAAPGLAWQLYRRGAFR